MEQSSRQRIDALDALRGIAILGILLLNISGFALLRVASFNPMHSGEATFADKLTWMGLNLFTQGKFLFILRCYLAEHFIYYLNALLLGTSLA
ncbi:hypothetical protein I3679_011370 [Proteus mirabilis]|uniref:DUF418 domain-containing protein n=1 Tax=Proteus mirabilis TaxID=584 RepID=A0ABD5LSW2_PROMI